MKPIKKPNGKWLARWYDPEASRQAGKKVIKGKMCRTRRDAEKLQATMLTQMGTGTYIDPSLGKVTVGSWFDRYLETANNLRPSTRATYCTMFNQHIAPHLGRRTLSTITRLDVETWVSTLVQAGVGPHTVSSAHRVLRRVLQTAVDAGVIGVNRAAGVKVPKGAAVEMRILNPADIDRLAEAVPPRYRALILFLAWTGCRIGEASALRLANLDLLRGGVNVVEAFSVVSGHMVLGETKTAGSTRTITLPSFLRVELERHITEYPPPANGLVFAGENGGALNRNNFRNRVWLKACAKAGLSKPYPRVHDLRHTSVALAIAVGAHPKEIQARAGHASIVMTMDRYGHLFEGQDVALAERLDTLRADGSELYQSCTNDDSKVVKIHNVALQGR